MLKIPGVKLVDNACTLKKFFSNSPALKGLK